MPTIKELVFVAAKRTPFGAFGKSLLGKTATDLAQNAAQACINQSGMKPEDIDASVFGNVCQSSSDAIYLARHVALRLGVPDSCPALTVNRLCGSGFEAAAQAAKMILMGEASTVLLGGSESMSQIPYVLRGARFGYRLGNAELEDSLMSGLTDQHVNLPMAMTAENLADIYKISRGECDDYALRSQEAAAQAWESGLLAKECTTVELKKRKETVPFSKDEHLRPQSTKESLGSLPPVFKKEGVVSAGNASGMVDGAAALILTSRDVAEKKGWRILGQLQSWAAAGCDPKIMGIGPVSATKKLFEWHQNHWDESLTVDNFDLIEVNEAFAAQYLAVEKEMGLPRDKTNIHGGAIAIGHPLGATGARLMVHLLYALEERGGGRALASACIGGGQGMSVALRSA